MQRIPKDAPTYDDILLLFIFMVPKKSMGLEAAEIKRSIDRTKELEPWVLSISIIFLFTITAFILTCFGRKLSVPINALTKYTNDLR